MSKFPIALIVSEFNSSVTTRLLKGALEKLEDYQFIKEDILVIKVPGVVEIPLTAKIIAKRHDFKAIVALGAVIKGETSHFDYVCEQVSQGCQKVTLDYEIPVVFGILTTENEAQALARAGGEHSNKGGDAIDCAIKMVNLIEKLKA